MPPKIQFTEKEDTFLIEVFSNNDVLIKSSIESAFKNKFNNKITYPTLKSRFNTIY